MTLSRARPQSQLEALHLPASPEALLAAERLHAEASADLMAVRANIAKIQAMVETGEREAALAILARRAADLEAAEEQTSRAAREARRSFSDSATRDITPQADAICEEAVAHIEAALQLVEKLSDVATHAGTSGLTIKHPQIGRADCIIRQLYAARGQLAPTPTMGVKQ